MKEEEEVGADSEEGSRVDLVGGGEEGCWSGLEGAEEGELEVSLWSGVSE